MGAIQGFTGTSHVLIYNCMASFRYHFHEFVFLIRFYEFLLRQVTIAAILGANGKRASKVSSRQQIWGLNACFFYRTTTCLAEFNTQEIQHRCPPDFI